MNDPVHAPVLNWRKPAGILAGFFGLWVPLAMLGGWTDPGSVFRFQPGWNSPVLAGAIGLMVAVLLILPLLWITTFRVMDLIGLALAHQALILIGYFFIEQTAASLGVSELAAVMEGLPWVILVNWVGWALLLPVLLLVYFWCQHRGYQLAPMRASAEELDHRLLPFLRVISVGLIGLIILPMAVTGAIPLIGGGQGTDVRYEMLSSGGARPLYHFATGLVPVVSAALLVSILRRWRKPPVHDLVLLAVMATLQVLSGNRLPLAIAMFMGATLLTLEFRLPRWVFPPLYVFFLGLFMFLGGFSSLMRTDRDRLKDVDPFFTSLSEVYMGNNVIDLRDGAWVMGHWDFQPLFGETYLGGLTAMAPSALFPKKHDWHLGLTAVRMVGMDPTTHFGLRITFFGEAFLNFGWAGVLGMAALIGTLWGTLLRAMHLLAQGQRGCLTRNLRIVILTQMCLPLTNTSDAFTFWTLAIFLGLMWLAVERFPGRANGALAHA